MPFGGTIEERRAKRRKVVREWRERNPEEAKTQTRKSYNKLKGERGKTRFNAYYLKNYGITLAQYDWMFLMQEGKCGICGKSDTRALCVDHDHETGKVRELLCNTCNTALGLFKEDRYTLEQAIAYLSRH